MAIAKEKLAKIQDLKQNLQTNFKTQNSLFLNFKSGQMLQQLLKVSVIEVALLDKNTELMDLLIKNNNENATLLKENITKITEGQSLSLKETQEMSKKVITLLQDIKNSGVDINKTLNDLNLNTLKLLNFNSDTEENANRTISAFQQIDKELELNNLTNEKILDALAGLKSMSQIKEETQKESKGGGLLDLILNKKSILQMLGLGGGVTAGGFLLSKLKGLNPLPFLKSKMPSTKFLSEGLEALGKVGKAAIPFAKNFAKFLPGIGTAIFAGMTLKDLYDNVQNEFFGPDSEKKSMLEKIRNVVVGTFSDMVSGITFGMVDSESIKNAIMAFGDNIGNISARIYNWVSGKVKQYTGIDIGTVPEKVGTNQPNIQSQTEASLAPQDKFQISNNTNVGAFSQSDIESSKNLIPQGQIVGQQLMGSGSGDLKYLGKPVDNVESKITSKPGGRARPVPGASTMHKGTDIGIPVGTEVHAAYPGVIAIADTQRGYGNVVYIKHAKGFETRYAHLSQMHVKPGQQVNIGDVIGLSGGARGAAGSGTSSGPHLHYELRRNNIPLSPFGSDRGEAPTSEDFEDAKKKEQEKTISTGKAGAAEDFKSQAFKAIAQNEGGVPTKISHAILGASNFSFGKSQFDLGQRPDAWKKLGFSDKEIGAMSAIGKKVNEAGTKKVMTEQEKAIMDSAQKRIEGQGELINQLDMQEKEALYNNLTKQESGTFARAGLKLQGPEVQAQIMDIYNQYGKNIFAQPKRMASLQSFAENGIVTLSSIENWRKANPSGANDEMRRFNTVKTAMSQMEPQSTLMAEKPQEVNKTMTQTTLGRETLPNLQLSNATQNKKEMPPVVIAPSGGGQEAPQAASIPKVSSIGDENLILIRVGLFA